VYLEYFNLREPPFNCTPGPRFFYLSAAHSRALDHLRFGVEQRRGFIVLTGEIGAGKTTLCRRLLGELGPAYPTAVILNPSLSETQLLRAIVQEFGIADPKGDRLRLRDTLNGYLLGELAAGRTPVLLIDEAQHMNLELLEQIRLLSNLETEDRKLVQIVLSGQPELGRKLSDPRLRQLRQRITVSDHLGPIAPAETRDYIRHRLTVAGANGRPTFDADTTPLIHRHAGGLPRLLNALCDLSLLAAYVDRVDSVTCRHVAAAVDDLKGTLA